MPIQDSLAKLDAASEALIHSVKVNEDVLDTVKGRLNEQDEIIDALPEVSVNESGDFYEIPDMNDIAALSERIERLERLLADQQ